jgi:predicted DNA-binding protein (MmcQ/YjbR family)
MNIEWLRRHCLSLRYTTESVQWGDNLVFKVGGKIFAILALDPGKVWLSFKCSEEVFAELVERPGIIPAPYLARNHWVALETEDALAQVEIKNLVRTAYQLVLDKLPKKTRSSLR